MPIMNFKSDGPIRVEESVRIKICEVKNLPVRSFGSPKSRSAYCALNLDQEQIYATQVVKNNFNPFFGEDFTFDVPRQFRHLNVYVFDKNDPSPNGIANGALGKVAIPKKDLQKFQGKDQWFPISPIDADSEVKGKVQMQITRSSKSLTVRIRKCEDLALFNKTCDPFAQISVEHPGSTSSSSRLGGQSRSYTTKTWKKTTNPDFDETFYFSDDKVDYSTAEIKVSIWHESSGVWGNVFLGETRIPVHTLDGGASQKNNLWYFLKPRDGLRERFSDQGSIRLNIRYTSESIIASQYYDPLRRLLLNLPEKDGEITSSAAFLLGEICEDKTEVVKPLVRIFLKYAQLLPLIRALGHLEMNTNTDVSTLFRGNTLLSKMVDETMRLAGKFYLESFMKEHIDKIYLEQKYCEIDPDRLLAGSSLQWNLAALIGYVEPILKSITTSALSCPHLISEILCELKQSARIKYPERQGIHYSVVAGFILLRFVAPAILNPDLFGLRKNGGKSEYVTRTLTLVSKAVQSVGNCLSNENNKVLVKEPYMKPILDRFCSGDYLLDMKGFLETVSNTNVIHSYHPVTLKEGFLTKRAQGKSRFFWRQLKKRYFKLTDQELHYSKGPNSHPLWRIPVAELQATQYLTEGGMSLDRKNTFKVVLPQRQLNIQAGHSVEAKEWKDALDYAASRNQPHRTRTSYHPAAFAVGRWQCCQSVSPTDAGCREVPSTSEVHVDIDVDREVEKIQSLLLKNLEKIGRLNEQNQLEFTSLTGDTTHERRNQLARYGATLNELHRACTVLEQEHRRQVKQVYQHNVYGSEFAPIGEDNLNYVPYLVALVDGGAAASRPSSVYDPPQATRC